MINAVEYSGVCTLALLLSLGFLRSACRRRDCYERALNEIRHDEELAARGSARRHSAWVRADAALSCECEPRDEKYVKYRKDKDRVFDGF